MGWSIQVLEGLASTIQGGVYNVLSSTPVQSLIVDNAALAKISEISGLQLVEVTNNLGETIGYVASGSSLANGTTEVGNVFLTLTKEATVVDQALIDSAVPLLEGGTTADLAIGTEIATVGIETAELEGIGAVGVGGTALSTVAGPAMAVALGIGAGVALYEIAPEFWTDVSERLTNAGQMIGDKVKSFFDKDGNTYYDDETLEILAECLRDYNMYDNPVNQYDMRSDENIYKTGVTYRIKGRKFPTIGWKQYFDAYKSFKNANPANDYNNYYGNWKDFLTKAPGHDIPDGYCFVYRLFHTYPDNPGWLGYSWCVFEPTSDVMLSFNDNGIATVTSLGDSINFFKANGVQTTTTGAYGDGWNLAQQYNTNGYNGYEQITFFNFDSAIVNEEIPVDEAKLKPIKIQNPSLDEDEEEKIYPVDIQLTNPISNDEDYEPVIDPDNNPIINPTDDPTIDPNNDPDPEPNPSPSPDPNPSPNPDPVDDPADPNDDITNEDDGIQNKVPFIPLLDFERLSNVYNPTPSEVESLGDYLWSANSIVDILKIFQNPMDGIISLHKVFGNVHTNNTGQIYLGYLPTGINSKIVSQQITEMNLGSIDVEEDKNNALDYAPYTNVEIYLPFIGFRNLNPYEVVGRTIGVIYRIDVYTGACIAQIVVNNGTDFNGILYEFSGNCAVEIPLTSGNMMEYLVKSVGSSVLNSGGSFAQGLANFNNHIIHDSLNVSRTGNLDSNFGMLGNRKPYLVVRRFVSYDANSYNKYYGYPSNKTVYLKNCSGYTKVKDIILHTSATSQEKNEIEQLLKEGVWI